MKKIIFIISFITCYAQVSAQAVYFRIGSETDVQGTEVVIPVTSENFTDIISMQGTISFDPAIISFVNTEDYYLPGMNSSCFGSANVASGELTFSWYDASLVGESIADNDTIFSVRFMLVGITGEISQIELTDNITPVEVIDNTFSEKIVYDQAGSATISGEPVSGDDVIFNIAHVEGENGTSIEVPVTVQNFTDILSVQGSFEFDEAIIQFVDAGNFGLPSMTMANFGTTSANSGELTVSWNDVGMMGVSLTDEDVIFTLNFNIIGSEGEISLVNLLSIPTPIEVVDLSLSAIDYTVSNGSVTVGELIIPDALTVSADSVQAAIGQYVEVPVRASSFTDIIAAQGSITFDPAVATFEQLTYFGLSNMGAGNFGLTQTGSGIISFSWNDPTLAGESIANDEILFTIQFLIVGNIGDESPVVFGNAPTPLEFVENTFVVVPFASENGNIEVIDLYDLEITSISDNELCAGEELTVNYNAIGNFLVTNTFTVVLSDETGSFSSSTNIGSVVSNVTGSVVATIPDNVIESGFYRIKLVASEPIFESNDNGSDITLHPLPTANAGSDEDICIGNSVLLTAIGGVDYEWDSGQLVDAIIVSPLADTEYIVTVTDGNSCENSDTVNVIVHDLPVVDAGSDEDICIGESVTLTAIGGVDYEWNSGELVDVIIVSPLVDTEYIVTVTDIWMCENSDTVNINVFEVFADAGIDEEICIGGSVILTAIGGTGYEWNSGELTDVITVSPLVDTEYIVTVTGVNSCTDIDTVFVTVHDLPTVNAGADEDICIGNSVLLTAIGGVDYEWDSGQLVDAIIVSPLADTEYIVTVTDGNSCENSDTVNVIVHDLPVVDAGSDEDICIGESVTLTAIGGVDYEWNSGELVDVIIVSPLVDTEYIVTVTDIWMCENSDTVNINVFEVFADAGTDEEICIGGSVTLTATGGTGYEWNPGELVDIITVSPLVDTEYIVTVTGVNSCTDIDTVFVTVHDLPTVNAGADEDICIGNSVLLTAIGGVDYEWDSGQLVDAIIVSPLADTEYIVTVTDGNSCENSDTVNVIVHDLPVVDAGSDEDICIGESVTLTAIGGVDYEWNSGELVDVIIVSPLIDTEYIVTATDVWMCENSDTVNVSVFEVFADAGTDEEICIGGSVTLTATGGTGYEWNSGELTDVITVSPLVDTEYIVTVTGVNSCTDIDTVFVTVHDLPTANAGSDEDICIGNSVTLTAIGGVDYEWNSGELVNVITVSPIVDTEYIVTVTDGNSCENIDTVNVIVHNLPTVDAGIDEDICIGETVTLTATGGVDFEWNSGELVDVITVSPLVDTEYIVTATDVWMCENSDTVNVSVFEVFADSGTDEEICIGGSVTLTATGGTSYEWNSGDLVDVITVSPLVDTEYVVTVTGVNSCTDTDTVNVIVINLPAIPDMPDGITERCQAEGTGIFTTNSIADVSYYWVVYPVETGTFTPTDNSLSLDWDIEFTGETGIYVESTNICGFSRSDTLFVQTNPSPFPNLGNDTTICAGSSLTLDAGTADSWTWSNSADTQTTPVSQEGIISVESFIGTCSNTDEIYVTISDADVEFGQDTIHSDVHVTLDAGTGFTEYLWNDNSTDQTMEVSNSGWYYVTVTNEFGCIDIDSVYFDIVSDINKVEIRVEFSIYPNPTKGLLTIELIQIAEEPVKVEIINNLGQIVFVKEINDNILELDLSNEKDGLYLIRIRNESEVVEYKIIKQ